MLEEATWTPPGEFDEYRIIRQLGKGSMGQVYLAHDLVLERPVAVKFLGAYRPDTVERERFLVEARAVARIQHPNVMAIYRVGEIAGRLYLVSEYIRGQSLAELELPLPSARVLEIGVGLARGLGAAHRQGVLHRDIKLSNAVIDEVGEVKLLDFGLAKLVDVQLDRPLSSASSTQDAPIEAPAPSASSSQSRSPVDETTQDLVMRAAQNARQMVVQRLADTARLDPVGATAPTPKVRRDDDSGGFKGGWSGSASITRQGTVMGTPHYMAPELWLADPASRRSDVFALGVLLFILASGKPPHDAESPFDLAMLVQEKDAPKLAAFAPGVDPGLAAIVDRCLERDPYQRFASAEELRSALEVLAAPRRPGAAPAGPPSGNPYRGLQAFEAEHRSLFFGRSAEIRAVVERLRSDSFVCVAGDSGVGKSSLCRAGVVPMVNEGSLDPAKTWRTVTMTPGRYPKQSFVAVVARGFGMSEDDVSALLKSEPEALVRALRRQLGESGGCLIFIDQFEEFVTIAEPAEVALIGPLVVRLLAGIPGLKVMATVRGDFLTRVATVPGLGDEVARGIFLLRPLSPEGAREAIVGPAQAHGVSFESEDLVDELVEAGVKGSLPLLQFALAELWESRDTSRAEISSAELRKIGGVTGALARHADGVLASLLPAQRQAARRLLMRLVTLDNTRASLTLDELAAFHDASKAALDALVRGRLLVVKEAGERMVYEIAHEALVGGWAQLAGWLEDEKEARAVLHRLEAAASEWERLGKGREGLWSASQVEEAGVLERGDLRPREVAFLEASSREAARAKVLRRVAIAAVPLLVAAVYGATWLQAQRVIGARIRAHTDAAEESLGAARRGEALISQLRREVALRFGSRDIEGGEALWAEARSRMSDVSKAYRDGIQSLESALSLEGGRSDVREALAQALFERARFYEGSGDPALVSDLIARLRIYDESGAWQREWDAPARVRLRVEPSGAKALLQAYAAGSDGSMVLGAARELDLVSGGEIEITPGSYLLALSAEGRSAVRYPFAAARREALSLDITMPPAERVPEGFVYVPAGRFLFGFLGDEDMRRSFYEASPLMPVFTDEYLIARHETTIGEYLEFLDDLSEEDRETYRTRGEGAGLGDRISIERRAGGWQIDWRFGGEVIVAGDGEDFVYSRRKKNQAQVWRRLPIAGVSARDAEAYLAWLDRSGRVPGARLCSEFEWERAARGADARLYPHGAVLAPDDANFDATYEHDAPAMGPDMVGSHARSMSPFGLHDMSGNVFEWVTSSLGDGLLVRGGSFFFPSVVVRTINRQVFSPETRSVHVGIRVCADYPTSTQK